MQRHEHTVRGGRPCDKVWSLGSGQPTSLRELCDPIDWKVCKAWQDRVKILVHRNFKPSAGFDHRDDGCDARPGLLAADVYQIWPRTPCALSLLGAVRSPVRSQMTTTCSGSVSSATSSWKGGFSGRLVYRADELRFKRSCFALRLAAYGPSQESVEVGFISKERFLYLALDLAR